MVTVLISDYIKSKQDTGVFIQAADERFIETASNNLAAARSKLIHQKQSESLRAELEHQLPLIRKLPKEDGAGAGLFGTNHHTSTPPLLLDGGKVTTTPK